jgi:glycosyltransferase involved in cell wall biosynthesis
MRRHAKKRGVSPIMKFYSRAELVDTINMCDLYVHTSEVEIEAISCLEAISCGLVPVINDSPKSATRYFAMDGKDLFALNDPKALAERIDYWIEHPEEKKERSEKYLGYAGQFDFDLCMDKMEKMLLEVSASKKKA